MRIGIDASRATRTVRTGTENYSLYLIKAMLSVDTDNRYTLYTDRPPAPQLFGGVGVLDVRVLRARRLWTHSRLALELRRDPPDVLFVPAHVLPAFRPCPSVVTIHDLGYLRYPQAHSLLSRLYLRLGTLRSVRAAARVVAVSEATKADLVSRLRVDPAKVVVVPEACPPGFIPLADRRAGVSTARRYGVQSPYIVALGSIHPRKNLVRLVEAFAIARQRGRLPHHLALVGQPGFRGAEVAAAVARFKLRDVVTITGYVDSADLPVLLGGADALVFPSLYEGFGLPALEAMSCGVPVIAANASSLPEVVGDAGILVDPLNVEAITDGIVRLLSDQRLRAEYASRGLARASAFTWERAARDTIAVLEAAAST
ncbi:MAG: glycosyltransferase family 4 protein [Chloroflexota bacterium]